MRESTIERVEKAAYGQSKSRSRYIEHIVEDTLGIPHGPEDVYGRRQGVKRRKGGRRYGEHPDGTTKERILSLLSDGKGRTHRELAVALNVEHTAIAQVCLALYDAGYLKTTRKTSDRKTIPHVWSLKKRRSKPRT